MDYNLYGHTKCALKVSKALHVIFSSSFFGQVFIDVI